MRNDEQSYIAFFSSSDPSTKQPFANRYAPVPNSIEDPGSSLSMAGS